jgi:cytochrome P450
LKTSASVNIHAFHHNPAIWGVDHAVFDPTRFYDVRAKHSEKLLMPFGVGRRSCVGQNLARTNILKMATTLVRAYEFEFLNADEPMLVVSHGDSDLVTPIMVKVRRRGEKFAG